MRFYHILAVPTHITPQLNNSQIENDTKAVTEENLSISAGDSSIDENYTKVAIGQLIEQQLDIYNRITQMTAKDPITTKKTLAMFRSLVAHL